MSPRNLALLSLPVLLLLSAQFTSTVKTDRTPECYISGDTSWQVQLNEMNYLVIKATSINLIWGLHLNKEQAAELKKMSEGVAALLPEAPDSQGKCGEDIRKIRDIYRELIAVLESRGAISNELQQKVFNAREKQAALIKKSLLGAQTVGYEGEDCLNCHCEPAQFPAGNISYMDTKAITPEIRKETDEAHVRGLFGDEATLLIWQLKDSVWNILSNGQRFVSKDYRCCLIPSDVITDPSRIGQAAFGGGWHDYLTETRKLNDKNWDAYKYLFLRPVEDLIRASLPGIREKEVRKRISSVESIIRQARKLSKLDFDIRKETLCDQLASATSIDQLNGESRRSEENRRFITAMFLLFHGSQDLFKTLMDQD